MTRPDLSAPPTALTDGPPKGRKVFGERSGKSRPRTNLVAATVKGKRLFAPLLFEGSLDAAVFNHYLKEQFLKEL